MVSGRWPRIAATAAAAATTTASCSAVVAAAAAATDDSTRCRRVGRGLDAKAFVPADMASTPFWLSSTRWPATVTGGTAAATAGSAVASPGKGAAAGSELLHARHTGGADGRALPSRVPVVVIGAGLSGAGAAYSIASRGMGVLLLDARGVSGGASGRNGGFLGGATFTQRERICSCICCFSMKVC
jgi:hypothetical protein